MLSKQELNEKLAELYKIQPYVLLHFSQPMTGRLLPPAMILLIDDSARMFDLMIEHNILIEFAWVNLGDIDDKYYTARKKNSVGATDIIFVKDHESQQAAARFAIAMALVKLAESK